MPHRNLTPSNWDGRRVFDNFSGNGGNCIRSGAVNSLNCFSSSPTISTRQRPRSSSGSALPPGTPPPASSLIPCMTGNPGTAAAARRQALSSCPIFSESASIHSPFSRTSPSPDFKSSFSSCSLSGVPPIAALTEKRSSESPLRKPRFPTVSNEICT